MENSTLAIVVPCYNEEEVLPQTNQQLTALLNGMMRDGLVGEGSYILYVNDGSRDRTWQLIEQYGGSDPHVRCLKLAGNVGHQNALMAGLDRSSQTHHRHVLQTHHCPDVLQVHERHGCEVGL